MSHEDPYRPNPGRDRGAYTPPTDDDLPFERGGYDPRRGGGHGGGGGGGGKSPPLTLIISGVVLVLLIIAVVVYYRAGPRSSNDAPPAVGTPVGDMKAAAPVDAQPIDPEAGIDVYSGAEPRPRPRLHPPPKRQPRPLPLRSKARAPAAPVTRRPRRLTRRAGEKAEPPAAAAAEPRACRSAPSRPGNREREYGRSSALPSLTRGAKPPGAGGGPRPSRPRPCTARR